MHEHREGKGAQVFDFVPGFSTWVPFPRLATPSRASPGMTDELTARELLYASAAPPALIDGSEIFTPGPMVELIETLFT